MKRTLVLLLLFLSTSGIVTPQTDRSDSATRAARKAARADLHQRFRQWMGESVFPNLSEWKAELDKAMTSEDLATLNRLRSEAKVLRGKVRLHRRGLREAWRNEDEGKIIEHRAGLTASRKAWLDIADELEILAFRYRETLKEIGKKAKPFAEEWRREGKEIFLKWKEEYAEILPDRLRSARMPDDLPGGPLRKLRLTRKRTARFMLWDGRREPDPEIPHDGEESASVDLQ